MGSSVSTHSVPDWICDMNFFSASESNSARRLEHLWSDWGWLSLALDDVLFWLFLSRHFYQYPGPRRSVPYSNPLRQGAFPSYSGIMTPTNLEMESFHSLGAFTLGLTDTVCLASGLID